MTRNIDRAKRPALSIIIVNYRTWEPVQRNLDSLLTATQGAEKAEDTLKFEIIIVDNHSDDGQLEKFRTSNPAVKVMLSEGNFGYAHGCNRGAWASLGDWLLFMNPDVISDRQNLQALVQAAMRGPWSILTAPQYDARGRLTRAFGSFPSAVTWLPSVRALARRLFPARYPNPRQNPDRLGAAIGVDWASGSLLLIKRREFQRLGGWDEDFWLYWEDVDLCRRARNHNMQTGYFPGARFIHTHAAATRQNDDVRVLTKSETLISRYLYLAKHHGDGTGLVLRGLCRVSNLISNAAWSAADVLTAGRSRRVRNQKRIHRRVARYLRRATPSGGQVSERSIHFCAGPGPAHRV